MRANNNNNRQLCTGSVQVQDNGEICVTGRVTFEQMANALGTQTFYQTKARTVSVNGMMIGGSANVNLGARSRFFYDFLTSYVVNGTEYPADSSTIPDNVLAASRGTVDGFCLRSDYVSSEEQWYEIRFDNYYHLNSKNSVDHLADKLADPAEPIGLLLCGYFNCAVEYHVELLMLDGDGGEPTGHTYPLRNALSATRYSLARFFIGLIPDWSFGILPQFTFTGLFRSIIMPGTYSTAKFPHPFSAPDSLGSGEAVQVDVHWDVLVKAMRDDGLFTTDRVPLFLNIVAQRILAEGKHYKCWNREGDDEATRYVALIAIEAPRVYEQEMDTFIEEVVYPKLNKYTQDISIHFGFRNPPHSTLVQSALNFYERCGVQTNLGQVEPCYHPACDRTDSPRDFVYPPKYYSTS